MTTTMRAFRGTVVGLLWAYLTVPAMLTFCPTAWKAEYIMAIFVMLIFLVPVYVILFGPGAYLLSWIHASQMERWAERARTRREIRTAGVLLGMPLGVGNLILTVWVISLFKGSLLKVTLTPELLILLIPTLAGGAGMGWGVTSDLLPRRLRTRPRPVIRRDGPPFFDARGRR